MARKYEIDIGDPEPSNVAVRKQYVATVSEFFRKFGTAKVNYILSQQLKELISPLNKPEDDVIIKGTINALSLILDWGDKMIAEDVANNLPPQE